MVNHPIDQPLAAVPLQPPDAELGLHLLLVEDSVTDQTMIERMLSKRQFELTVCETLANGLEFLRTHTVDAAIVDLSLPDCSHLETVRTLRERHPDLPLVVLTSHTDERIAHASLQIGAQDYLIKGRIDSMLLARSLRYSIERMRASQAVRQSERRYRALVAATAAIVFRANDRGEFTEPQPSWAAYTGQTWEEQSERGWVARITPDDRELFLATWEKAAQTRTPVDFETQLWHAASESWRHAVVRAVPLDFEAPSEPEWVGQISDVEDVYLAETALRQTERLASLGELCAGIAHEINNPVSAIWSSAQAGLTAISTTNEPGGEGLRSYLENITMAAERCATIVEDMLRFARRTPPPKTIRSIVDLVKSAMEICDALARRHNATVQIVSTGHDKLDVLVSAIEIEQVFVNLIRNAIAAVGDSPPKVTVTMTRVDKSARVQVTDNGSGLTPEVQRRAFEPFFTTRESGGTGLGLSIAHRIIADHNGSISIAPDISGGCRVTVDLPLSRMGSSPSE